jgi:TonB family protein
MRGGRWWRVYPNWRLRSFAVLKYRGSLRVNMRRPAVLFVLVLAGIGISYPQSSSPTGEIEPGSINNGIYTNQALGITWEIPKDWVRGSESGSLLGDDYHAMLQLLPGGTQSKERVEIDYSRAGDASRLTLLLQSKHWESSGRSERYTLGGGILAYRYDYKAKDDPPRYLTLLNGQHHGNVIVAFLTDSPARIDELVKVALQMRVQPDWGSPEESPRPIVPGSPPRRVRVSEGVSQALLERKVQPTYPKEAGGAGIQGSVVMLAHISTEGAIKNLFVISGPPQLTQAALDAVSQWRYKPYLLLGNPVEVETQITVNFALQ